MKGLVKILLAGFLAFVAVALVQERQVFLSAWFGAETSAPEEVPPDHRRQAEEAVTQMLTMMRHLYSSNGDSRFAERMPAGQLVVDEFMEDIAYLRRNHRRQEPVLMQLTVDEVYPFGQDRLQVRTTEHWIIHILWLDGGAEAERPHALVVNGTYAVAREPAGWRVTWWESEVSDRRSPEPAANTPAVPGDGG